MGLLDGFFDFGDGRGCGARRGVLSHDGARHRKEVDFHATVGSSSASAIRGDGSVLAVASDEGSVWSDTVCDKGITHADCSMDREVRVGWMLRSSGGSLDGDVVGVAENSDFEVAGISRIKNGCELIKGLVCSGTQRG